MSALPAIASRRGSGRRFAAVALRCAAALCLAAGCPSAGSAQDYIAPVTPVAVISVDDDNRKLNYPWAVDYDPIEDEIYLVNGSSSRVVVYGPDFFPRMSIGVGRGVAAPQSSYVVDSGQVYIVQARNRNNPVPRITILNAAFFVEREISLDEIPEAAGMSPRRVAVSRDGLIYLTGEASRGVLVLDRDGYFLRRLQPMDMIADRAAVEVAAREQEEQEQLELKRQAELEGSVDGEAALADEGSRPEIPEEFRPRGSREDGEARSGPGLGPVRVRFVHIDSAGKLYLVSGETSRIYVYSPQEEFLFAFGEKGGTPRKLSQPRALAIDEQRGLIFVADYMRHTILAYSLSGEYLFEVGGRGFGPGWFNFPSDIAINRHGQLIVCDMFNHRIQVLDVQFEGAFKSFRGRGPTAPGAAAAEGAPGAEAVPAPADGSETPEGTGGEEPAGEPRNQAAPDAAVEEVTIPPQESSVPEEGAAEGAAEAEVKTAVETEVETEPAAGEGAAPAAFTAPLGGAAEAVPSPAVPVASPDEQVEEQVIPEQILPAYPAEKQD